jgi:hypothetical protein
VFKLNQVRLDYNISVILGEVSPYKFSLCKARSG